MDQRQYDSIVSDLAPDLAISRDNVSEAMMNQPEKYVHYALAYQRAVKHCKLLEFRLEEVEASIDRWLVKRFNKVTEKMLRTACLTRDNYKQMKRELIDAEDRRDSLESIVRAMEHRKDMLVNFGATVREEIRLTSGGDHVNKTSSRNR
jgi:exonuclease VII small subunit